MDDGVSAAGVGFLVSGLVSRSGLGGRVVLLLIFRLRLPRIVPVALKPFAHSSNEPHCAAIFFPNALSAPKTLPPFFMLPK